MSRVSKITEVSPESTVFFHFNIHILSYPLGAHHLPHDCWICAVTFFAVKVGLEKAAQTLQNHIKWVSDFDLIKSIKKNTGYYGKITGSLRDKYGLEKK